MAKEAGVQGKDKLQLGWSLDLTTDDPRAGLPWDMGKREVRNRVRQLVEETRPVMLIGFPPCTLFSSFQYLKQQTRDPARFKKRLENAQKHIRFCVELCRMPMEGGSYFSMSIQDVQRRCKCERLRSWRPRLEWKAQCATSVRTTCNALAAKSSQFLTNAPEFCKRIMEFGGSLITPLSWVELSCNARYILRHSARQCVPVQKRKIKSMTSACAASRS